MPMMPFQIVGIWLRGLLALAILGGGIALIRQWDKDRHVRVVEPAAERPAPDRADATADADARPVVTRTIPLGLNLPTAELLGGIALLALGLGGGSVAYPLLRRKGNADEDPKAERTGEVHKIKRPDGSELHVETYGPADADPIVLTHGWGANSTEWFYAKKHLAKHHRLIVWDLPGLGKSTRPANNEYRLENLADDLGAVLELAGSRPALLLGHSIGGMIMLTFCRTHAEALNSRVSGLVLVHTTYTNPVRTTNQREIWTALQGPVVVPLCHLMIWLSPLVWALNWLSYFNGSAHRSTDKSSFCQTETRGQLDFCTRFMPMAWPGVLARGMLGMLKYDATQTLGTVSVPTLVIAGDRDTTTNPDASVTMAEAIPRTELVTLAPAKHMGLIEHHDRWVQVVEQFAQSVARRHPITSEIE